MVAFLGLLLLVAAALAIAAGVSGNGGAGHGVGGDFSIAGLHLSGLSTGELFGYGVVVGGLAALGGSLVLGRVNRRITTQLSRRALGRSRRETTVVRLDRDRLTRELDAFSAVRGIGSEPPDPADHS